MNENIERCLEQAQTSRTRAEKEYVLDTTTEIREVSSRLGGIYYMLDALYQQNQVIIAQNEARREK